MRHEELARVVPLSRHAVHERVKRLDTHSIIRRYQARIDWSALGQPLTTFTWVMSREKSGDTLPGVQNILTTLSLAASHEGSPPNGTQPQLAGSTVRNTEGKKRLWPIRAQRIWTTPSLAWKA